MLIDAGRYRLQLERQSSFAQQFDSTQAAVVRAGNLRQGFVGFAGAAVQRNLDGEGRPLQ